MTHPSQEVIALKGARKFITEECVWQTLGSMLKIIFSGRFHLWQQYASSCLRNFPTDSRIDSLFGVTVEEEETQTSTPISEPETTCPRLVDGRCPTDCPCYGMAIL